MPGKPVRKLVAAAVCAAAFAVVAVSRNADPSSADPPAAPPGGGPAFVLGPYLQFATRTSITVMCETDSADHLRGRVRPHVPAGADGEVQKPDTLHEVTLDGLQPNAEVLLPGRLHRRRRQEDREQAADVQHRGRTRPTRSASP